MSSPVLLLLPAALASLAGMGWLALAMEDNWQRVHRDRPLRPGKSATLRCIGALAVAAALLLCLRADHPTMAVLVWVMSLSAAALAVTLLLAWRPTWLAWLCR